jgi:hypothetical protein
MFENRTEMAFWLEKTIGDLEPAVQGHSATIEI